MRGVNESFAHLWILQGVHPEAAEALSRQLTPIDFTRGQTIFAEGDSGDQLFIIVAGKVKVGRRTADGRESMIALIGPSDMFGELTLFDPGPRTFTVTALTDVRAVTMDHDSLRAWIRDHARIGEQLLRVLARRLRRTNDSLVDLIFSDVPGRVAKQLLQMAQRFGTRDGDALRVDHELTQEEMAQLVGSARETVNKALADFSRRGWIRIEVKSILIVDAERLAYRARQ